MDVEIVNVTGVARRRRTSPGRDARELLARARPTSTSRTRRSPTSTRSRHTSPACPCLLLRIGFVGELGYELHFPSPYGEHLWDTMLERGADLGRRAVRPRAPADPPPGEDAHPRRPGHRLRVERRSRPAMPWIAKLDKDDFVGKWALEHVAGARLPRAARRLRDGERRRPPRRRSDRRRRPARRPRHERALERPPRPRDRHGLGAAELAEEDAELDDQGRTARLERPRVRLRAVLRPGRGAAPLVSQPRLPRPDLATADAVWRSPLERALAHAPAADPGHLAARRARGPRRRRRRSTRTRPRSCGSRPAARSSSVPSSEAGRAAGTRLAARAVRHRHDRRARRARAAGRGADAAPDRPRPRSAPGGRAVADVRALVARATATRFRICFPQEYGRLPSPRSSLDAAGGPAA